MNVTRQADRKEKSQSRSQDEKPPSGTQMGGSTAGRAATCKSSSCTAAAVSAFWTVAGRAADWLAVTAGFCGASELLCGAAARQGGIIHKVLAILCICCQIKGIRRGSCLEAQPSSISQLPVEPHCKGRKALARSRVSKTRR